MSARIVIVSDGRGGKKLAEEEMDPPLPVGPWQPLARASRKPTRGVLR